MLVDRQNLVLWADIKAYSAAGVSAKGTPPPAIGGPPSEPDPGDQEAKPGDDDDDKDPAESLPEYMAQRASFRRRFREALRKLPPVTEDGGGDGPASGA